MATRTNWRANSINGPLACTGNSGIGDDQQPNTVQGPASRQCATGFT